MDNTDFQKKVLAEFSKMQSKLEKLDTIEDTLNTFKSQFEEHEAKKANRHIEIVTEIDKLRRDILTIEGVTAKNWSDIVELKKAK
ncbi:hypothetical protein RBH29_01235 [Herbivorax sp. ANBcel31]|uniref:hypothetical protein n=1 Tax=Herbivorax sp. ANBcel31 TaxID=3069754 RepID=UPI0027B25792|nr:hypothetical protein [Herbivorax sp. ANBcel31]MDQ2085061.1 hypothetical protein [Herbivorax sp. ANBcel31]